MPNSLVPLVDAGICRRRPKKGKGKKQNKRKEEKKRLEGQPSRGLGSGTDAVMRLGSSGVVFRW